jgi:hypothetical protein
VVHVPFTTIARAGTTIEICADQRGPSCQTPMTLPAGTRMVAIDTGTTVGPVLRVAPVVGGQVIFSSAGCWDTSGVPTQPFHGRLTEIPGSGSYGRAAAGGFHAVPLSTVERLISGTSGT